MADDIAQELHDWQYIVDESKGDAVVVMLSGRVFGDAAAEIERLRNAIDSVLINIDGDHQPEWASAEAKAAGKKPWCCQWCGPQDGSWPCVHRMVLDELKEARRG